MEHTHGSNVATPRQSHKKIANKNRTTQTATILQKQSNKQHKNGKLR